MKSKKVSRYENILSKKDTRSAPTANLVQSTLPLCEKQIGIASGKTGQNLRGKGT